MFCPEFFKFADSYCCIAKRTMAKASELSCQILYIFDGKSAFPRIRVFFPKKFRETLPKETLLGSLKYIEGNLYRLPRDKGV